MKSHYELLDVTPDAPAEQIKKAFRREIARYHPDKVQHLGREFQEIASQRASELTEAYRVLMDDGLRAEYDERLKSDNPASGAQHSPRDATSVPPAPASAGRPAPAAEPEMPPSTRSAGAPPNVGPATSEFVRKVGTSRVRDAVTAVSGSAIPVTVPGFDAAYDIKGKGGLFKKSEPTVRLLMKFVPLVDTGAISASWLDAVRAAKCQDHVCVLLLLGAAGMSPSRELSAAIAEQRRKTRAAAPLVVPVDARDWEALFPPDTPSSVRSIMQWLQQGTA